MRCSGPNRQLEICPSACDADASKSLNEATEASRKALHRRSPFLVCQRNPQLPNPPTTPSSSQYITIPGIIHLLLLRYFTTQGGTVILTQFADDTVLSASSLTSTVVS